VKLLRIGVLVLLAVLLPVRGAMAATMFCQPAGGGHDAIGVIDHGAATADPVSGHAPADRGHDHARHGHGGGTPDHSTQDKCNVCSASCSSLPLPSASTGIEEPSVLASVSYRDLPAPAPTFQSDGQERPPRTC
jgi:hypothetical protein